MGQLLVSLIVPALLIAVNPVPIIVAVTLLATDHGRRSAAIFGATLALVMAVVGVLTIFLLGQAGSSSQQSGSTASAALQTLFGVAFLAMFALQWRAKPSREARQPGWMKAMDKAGFTVAVVLGVTLTNYALLGSGSTKILESGLPAAEEVAGLVFFIVLAISTVVVPLVIYLVRPVWAGKQLSRLKDWLTLHNRALLMGVFGLMGLLFTAEGLINLLG
jgi:Sap, sulfolipid-1-addressing protein